MARIETFGGGIVAALALVAACSGADEGSLTDEVAQLRGPPEAPRGGCEGASGVGRLMTWYCDLHYPAIIAEDYTCEHALDVCVTKAVHGDPSFSYYCTWDGQFLHEAELVAGACDWAADLAPQSPPSAEACDGAIGDGWTLALDCATAFPVYPPSEKESSCDVALDACTAAAAANPGTSVYCLWNGSDGGRTVFESEVVAGDCDWLSDP